MHNHILMRIHFLKNTLYFLEFFLFTKFILQDNITVTRFSKKTVKRSYVVKSSATLLRKTDTIIKIKTIILRKD